MCACTSSWLSTHIGGVCAAPHGAEGLGVCACVWLSWCHHSNPCMYGRSRSTVCVCNRHPVRVFAEGPQHQRHWRRCSGSVTCGVLHHQAFQDCAERGCVGVGMAGEQKPSHGRLHRSYIDHTWSHTTWKFPTAVPQVSRHHRPTDVLTLNRGFTPPSVDRLQYVHTAVAKLHAAAQPPSSHSCSLDKPLRPHGGACLLISPNNHKHCGLPQAHSLVRRDNPNNKAYHSSSWEDRAFKF